MSWEVANGVSSNQTWTVLAPSESVSIPGMWQAVSCVQRTLGICNEIDLKKQLFATSQDSDHTEACLPKRWGAEFSVWREYSLNLLGRHYFFQTHWKRTQNCLVYHREAKSSVSATQPS